MRPLYARAARDNVASLRVLEKCGFVQVGTSRGWANARGEVVDEILLEWTPGRTANSGKP
jgi:RimJ/RimL family protein N-acetyltransferase